MLGMGPHMRVEPRQLISGGAANGRAEDGIVRIEDIECTKKFIDLARCLPMSEQSAAARNWMHDGSDELHQRLMRNPKRVSSDTSAKQLGCNPLLSRVTDVNRVNEDVCINERCCHDDRDPLSSSRARRRVRVSIAASAAVLSVAPSPDRRVSTSARPTASVWLAPAPHELRHPRLPIQLRPQAGYQMCPRSPWEP